MLCQEKTKVQLNNGLTDSPYTQIKFQGIVASAVVSPDQPTSKISDIRFSDTGEYSMEAINTLFYYLKKIT